MQQAVLVSEKQAIPKVVSRLAGALPQLETAFAIGNGLRVETYRVPGSDLLPESRGAMVCLPLGDDLFSLQIAYVLEDEDGLRLVCLHFFPDFFRQWPRSIIAKEAALGFDHTADHELRLDLPSADILSQLLAVSSDTFGDALHQMELMMQLLRRALEQLRHPFAPCPVPACRFLAYETEREKIFKARDILDEHYDEKLTIKALARKVAMNECYLKKGFKTLTGSTIHDYVAKRRIATAKQMLQVEGLSVTEVAARLGYSSISHFSTAFKKATGLKPCELLA